MKIICCKKGDWDKTTKREGAFLGCRTVGGGHDGFVGLLGGELLGSFDGVADGCLLRLAINVDAAFVLASPLMVMYK